MRPIIVGLNNPHSADPQHALYPHPVGCSGWRLWKMIHDASAMSSRDYVAAFDRRNLVLKTKVGGPNDVERGSKRFLRSVQPGSVVIALGAVVAQAIGISYAKQSPMQIVEHSGSKWCWVPHPSGRNLYYNDAMNRWNVGRFLADLSNKGGSSCAA